MYCYVLLRVVFFMLRVNKRIVLHVRYSTNEADINFTNSSLKIAKRVPQSGQKKVSEKRHSYISSRITGDWIN